MAKEKAHRKYQLTINNPLDHGFSHEKIKSNLSEFNLKYWCLCDEIGLEEKTPHTHVYFTSKNAIMFSTVHQRFYGAHIEPALGTDQQNRDYIRKEGEYSDSEKKETNIPETFEEWGEMQIGRLKGETISTEVFSMIKDGCSDLDILEVYPAYMTKISALDSVRQKLRAEKYAKCLREMNVQYIFGDTGTGKTRSVYETYGYDSVYRVSDYNHPFDGYTGENVLVLDEFRSNLTITFLLQLIDIYPLVLPCRYADKQACFENVIIISNIPLKSQYTNVQIEEPETWKALYRRINSITKFEKNNGQYPFNDKENIIKIEIK